jgi:glycine/D-amino acid oxidase-like deaminating enzyme
MTHGQRATYQHGCRCLLCRAAEATYRRQLRRLKAHGKQPLGALISAAEARRRIRQLQAEHVTKAAIARLLGHAHPILQLDRPAVTVRTHLRLRRIARLLLHDPMEHRDAQRL